MTDGDLSALLTILAVPVGGLIAGLILWLLLKPNTPRPSPRQSQTDPSQETP